MPISRPVVGAFVFLVILLQPLGLARAEEMRAGGAAAKAGRGVINTVTGWVEIPKRIYETSAEQGAAAGWTWGLLRGIGRGFIRTAAGLYEVVTFPFPAPPNYESVIQPEYVFVDEGTAASSSSRNR